LNTDKAWGIRDLSAEALGHIGGPAALKQLLAALDTNDHAAVRYRIVSSIGSFKDDPSVSGKLEAIARDDHSYRARASALEALGRLKSPNALGVLNVAVAAESPDDFLRDAALRSLGFLGDDKAVPLLREWSAPGKPMDSRTAAIASLGRLDKDNKDITKLIASYLAESHFPARWAAIFALGNRGDAMAVPNLEALLKSDDLSIEMVPMIKEQIEKLQKRQAGKDKPRDDGETEGEGNDKDTGAGDEASVSHRFDKLERLVQEMNEHLKSIEARLPPAPKK
jgi:HEAT repeat protein